MGALKLDVYQNGTFLKEVPVTNGEIWVGRDADCGIQLEDRAISRKHALLTASDQGVEFERKSKFGVVKINGKDSEQTTLRGGDRIEFGPFEIRVKADTTAEKPQITGTIAADPESEVPVLAAVELRTSDEPPVDPVQDSGLEGIEPLNFDQPEGGFAQTLDSAPPTETGADFDFAKVEADGATKVFSSAQNEMKAVLQFGTGAANVTQFELTESEAAIGRSQKCNVILEDKKSSRKHSLVRKEGSKFFVKDLGSANGTLVNGERVADERELQSGDVLTIGDTQFTFMLVQADYEQKKEAFIPVPVQEAQAVQTPAFAPSEPVAMATFDMNSAPVESISGVEAPAPDFTAPPEQKKSFIGKFLDRYRAMNTKQQVIWGAAIVAVLWMLLDDEPEQKKAKLNTGGNKPKVAQKKGDQKQPGVGASFENLTPEQQSYVQNQNQLALDYFKNRDYDSALLEVQKIFSIVQDYKGARTIETLAREGKRRLEAQEEERKKKEQERLAQEKIQSLIDQAGLYMQKGAYKEAEALFPEIEVLQPENTTVGEWRKKIVAENERLEKEQAERKRISAINSAGWSDFKKASEMIAQKNYWDALDLLDEVATRPIQDKKLVVSIKDQIQKAEDAISAEREPLLAQGKQLEGDMKFADAYRAYQKAAEVDPTSQDAIGGMNRIRGNLTGKAKSIYAEGVFAESYGDMDTAEKQYRQVLEVVPNDDDYYVKAQSRLKKLTVLRKPASESSQ